MGAGLNSHNFLSAVLILCTSTSFLQPNGFASLKMGFSFLPDGSNNHKNFEAPLLDYVARSTKIFIIFLSRIPKSELLNRSVPTGVHGETEHAILFQKTLHVLPF